MPAIRMTMPQKGISRTMLEMRRRVSEASCASVVRAPKTWRTVRNLAATRLRRCATAVRSCSRAKAARLPLERAVSASTDMGKSFQSTMSETKPTDPQSRRLYRKTPSAEGGDQEYSSVLRSEEHTSELQSPCNLVCRLLLEKKKTQQTDTNF